MSEVVVVANRGPATLYQDDNGVTRASHAAGGLAPSLRRASFLGTNATWVAAATTEIERRAAADGPPEIDPSFELHLVDIDPHVTAGALRVIANETLWFCYHGLFDHTYRPVLGRAFFEAWDLYRAYNGAIASAVAECADHGARVVVNDYHLSLLGSQLKRLRPDLSTVHFSHTPFCSPEELEILPAAIGKELIDSLCAFGACGFHTKRWADRFVACATALGSKTPEVFVSPLGVDANELELFSSSPACDEKRAALKERLDGKKLILRSDRLEPSKNVLRGFLAFEELLSQHPAWLGRVIFVARVYPSREDIPEYLAYRSSVEQVVDRINERFGSNDYQPIQLDVADDFAASIAASSIYDVLLVNPLRDGMNLVAKEGPAINTNNGVLALSKQAGAYAELSEVAIGIEPFNVSGTAAALERALSMDSVERSARASAAKAIASSRPPDQWFADLLDHARSAAGRS